MDTGRQIWTARHKAPRVRDARKDNRRAEYGIHSMEYGETPHVPIDDIDTIAKETGKQAHWQKAIHSVSIRTRIQSALLRSTYPLLTVSRSAKHKIASWISRPITWFNAHKSIC